MEGIILLKEYTNDVMDVTGADLVRRARQGDPQVIGALYDRFHLAVFRYLYYRVGDRETAEDLTSEVFLRLVRTLSLDHSREISFQAWLFRIARNLATDHFRRMSAQREVRLEEDMIAAHDNPVRLAEANLTSESLRLALAKVSEEQREVVVLRFVAGMPIGEVAQILEKSEDAVKGLQRRGLMALRAILDHWGMTVE